jgi:arginyl-tRNA synthetase
MAWRLARLRDEKIVADGMPTPIYKRRWQTMVERIEDAIASITSILDGLTGVEGSLTGLQAQSDILDAVSDLTGTGLVEKTGDAAFAVRAIGVDTASAVIRRADGDTRYLRQDGTLAASAATTTHKLAVDIGGTTYYILLSNV